MAKFLFKKDSPENLILKEFDKKIRLGEILVKYETWNKLSENFKSIGEHVGV